MVLFDEETDADASGWATRQTYCPRIQTKHERVWTDFAERQRRVVIYAAQVQTQGFICFLPYKAR
jgi:hypothetical protein